jgi:hypothetical protein
MKNKQVIMDGKTIRQGLHTGRNRPPVVRPRTESDVTCGDSFSTHI